MRRANLATTPQRRAEFVPGEQPRTIGLGGCEVPGVEGLDRLPSLLCINLASPLSIGARLGSEEAGLSDED